MSVDELVRGGDLPGAIQAQAQAVKSRPADLDARARLVQLLAMAGELDRAETHLLTMAQQDQALQVATSIYSGLLSAEEERRRVFAGSAEPNLPPEVPGHVHDRVAALAAVVRGRAADAGMLLERANGVAPPVAGSVDGAPFRALSDHDEWLGPVLEVFAGGRYLWVPFARLASLEFAPPRSTLDLVWRPVQLVEAGGTQAQVHVPVGYAGSSAHADGMVRCLRKTEWEDVEGIAFRGYGPRILLADADRELPLLAVRRVEFAGAAA